MLSPEKPSSSYIQRIYYLLTLLSTLATSFIWGINTLFLLDAGLNNAQAFLVNSFFTVGQVLFEVPTGVVADIRGRRTSYLLGTITLSISTLAYLGAWQAQAPIWVWAIASILIGLGFTFFSGATEAWLVDALNFTGYKESLETVFSRGQAISGIAMLVGSVAGGWIAQSTNLGVPYILRGLLLFATFIIGFFFMRDWGWQAVKSVNLKEDVRQLFQTSFDLGLRKPEIRWVMLAAPFTGGVGIYVFYAMQPHLLELFGDPNAYSVAGLAAAIIAIFQVVGGLMAPKIRGRFEKRTTVLLLSATVGVAVVFGIGAVSNFWIAIGLFSFWSLIFAAALPIRQAYMNSRIPSAQRATVLSFDALMGSSGGVVAQPVLGRVADIAGYPQSFTVSGVINILALPFLWLAHKQPRSEEENTD